MFYPRKVDQAAEKLQKISPPTPCQKNKFLSDKYGAEIYLKREDLTPVRSYKLRGAFNFIACFFAKNPDKNPSEQGFVAASAGNHAQGFAFSCQKYGAKGTIFMPVTTPGQKIEKTKIFGGDFIEIVLIGDTFDQAAKAAAEFCQEKKALLVPPFEHEKIIEGQATVGKEILEQVPDTDLVIVPVGGGGLSSGLCQYFAERSSKTKILLTEPFGAPSLKRSLQKGENITLDTVDTFADGTAVAKIGDLNFEILQQFFTSEDVILCPENRLARTMLELLNHEGVVLEPSGALSIDALQDVEVDLLKGKKIVCIASGGNFDFERLPDVKERAMKFSGTKKYFILRLPQRPGALKEFLNCLGSEDDIARFEYLKKSAKNFGSVLLGIETKRPENFPQLFARMKKLGFDYTDVTDDEILADFVI
jgi:threonine dehydratase